MFSEDKNEDVNVFHTEPPIKGKKKVSQPLLLIWQLLLHVLLIFPNIIWSIITNFFFTKKKSLKGNIVLVTGAAKGFGRGLALEFAKHGCTILCVDLDKIGNDETVSIINNEYPGKAKAYVANVAISADTKKLQEQVEKDFDRVDILVNNAGLVALFNIMYGEDDLLDGVIKVNLFSHLLMVRRFLPNMMKRNSGHIVAISSAAALTSMQNAALYTATKYGVNGYMACLNEELKSTPGNNIKTTTVCPYCINTSALYMKHCDLRLPEISVEYAATVTVDSVRRNERILTIPKLFYWLLTLEHFLPDTVVKQSRDVVFVKIADVADETIKAHPGMRIVEDTLSRSEVEGVKKND